MVDEDWETLFNSEIVKAEQARSEGNEGKARVCARRAAGQVIGEYLRRQGVRPPGRSAYNRLQYLHSLTNTSPQVREVAGHFLMRITPEHTLPVETDLVGKARWLKQTLLGD
ncbi:MAG TPA: hypothetical protein VE136_06340 [Anaerolineales bacterium]|jgi:hypothetical protein|nr:hypothetical protein [Anaerolineales bacterium]